MRSVILEYSDKLDILTKNPSVKNYFTGIGHEASSISKVGVFPEVNIYDNVGVLHLWLNKLVYNIPTKKPRHDHYYGNRWKFARWVNGGE